MRQLMLVVMLIKIVMIELMESSLIDLGKDLSIQGGVEMNDATTMEGSSVIIGEQNIVQDGVTFIQDLLTMVDFNNDKDQAFNSEELEW